MVGRLRRRAVLQQRLQEDLRNGRIIEPGGPNHAQSSRSVRELYRPQLSAEETGAINKESLRRAPRFLLHTDEEAVERVIARDRVSPRAPPLNRSIPNRAPDDEDLDIHFLIADAEEHDFKK